LNLFDLLTLPEDCSFQVRLLVQVVVQLLILVQVVVQVVVLVVAQEVVQVVVVVELYVFFVPVAAGHLVVLEMTFLLSF
jgi:hypothetical protein